MTAPILGLGEILWDLLPDGPQLGGAPFNFAYHCHQLGRPVRMLSRIGDDPLGQEIRQRLDDLHLDATHLQVDPAYPTGTVSVTVDGQGQPSYTIHENVAWDYLAWTPDLEPLMVGAAAICYGSLIQRSPTSRATVQRLLALDCPTLRVFDINLRQHYWNREILETSLHTSDWLKLNDDELATLTHLLGLSAGSVTDRLDELRARYNLQLVCLTRGAHGCRVRTAYETIDEPGIPVRVVDTVGAGDAFTAALVVGFLEGRPLSDAVRRANRLAAAVAGSRGGTPRIDPASL